MTFIRLRSAAKAGMLLLLAFSLGAVTLPVSAQPDSSRLTSFNIPAQNLDDALTTFAQQSGQELLYSPATAAGITGNAVEGSMTRTEAMAALLEGTGLEFELHPSGSMLIGDEAALQTYRQQLGSSVAGQNTIGQRRPGIEEIIVTGQKKEERIQDVPIAISAFTQEDLTTSQIAGGPDLHLQVPNMTFTKTNFTGYSIQIRGIGTQAISATTDPAVAVALNQTPFIRNRFFEQEFYDLERVEVLRGPQGTLFGRNATAGVVNLITAKPKFQNESMVSLDTGNYNSRRWEFMVNNPLIDDKLALRLAAAGTKRDGYATNEITDSPIDGRDLWSTRVSLRFAPNDRLDMNLIWEHFEEEDDRLRSGKQLCKTDEVTEVAGYPTTHLQGLPESGQSGVLWSSVQAVFSQGCKRNSLYAADSFQTPNGIMLPYYVPLGAIGLPVATDDPYESRSQSRDLRVIESTVDPDYRARSDIGEIQISYNLTDDLILNSETAYSTDEIYSQQDFNRFNTASGVFTSDRFFLAEDLILDGPNGGIFCDPQIGCADRLVAIDVSSAESSQFSQEFRLSSQFGGPFNFSIGANYLRYDTEDKYYVFINTLTLVGLARAGFAGDIPPYVHGKTDLSECLPQGLIPGDPNAKYGIGGCIYTDPNPIGSVNDLGHNYFLSKNPFRLDSYAVFGETYWNITDELKLTAGLRWSVDEKTAPLHPSWLFVGNTVGYPVKETVEQTWREPTGRLVADWKPNLAFTDETLVYGSISRGYKAGGANPPPYIDIGEFFFRDVEEESATRPKTFDAEFVNAFEVGTKNTLLDGALTLNLAGFYYDYTDYQISEIVDRQAFNRNFDADIWGLEIEADWWALENLRLNFKGGYQKTSIADGESAIDLMNRTADGKHFVVTETPNPNFDDSLEPDERRPVSEYVAANTQVELLSLPEDQEFVAFDDWTLHRPFPAFPSSCILPTFLFDGGNRLVNVGSVGGGGPSGCETAYISGFDPVTELPYVPDPTEGIANTHAGIYYPGWDPATAPNNGEGIAKDLSGNDLPNAPHYTTTLSADYIIPLSVNWSLTLHTDLYWQSGSWWRVFNDHEYNRLDDYFTMNLAAIVASETGWNIMAYVKNFTNETAITGAYLGSDDTGLTTNVFLTEPRLYGLRVTRRWDGDGPAQWLGHAGAALLGKEPGEPSPWELTLGGQLLRPKEANNQVFAPEFISAFDPNIDPTQEQGQDLDWGDGREIELTYAPENGWQFSLGARFGESGRDRRKPFVGQTSEGCPKYAPLCEPGGYSPFPGYDPIYIGERQGRTTYGLTELTEVEEHLLIDFAVGRDVGLGGFAQGTLSAGLRYAQFKSATDAMVRGQPDWVIPADCLTVCYLPNPFAPPRTNNATHHEYAASLDADREFEGIGPVVAWEASSRLLGDDAAGRLDLDWSVSGGVLFGRQRATAKGFMEGLYYDQPLSYDNDFEQESVEEESYSTTFSYERDDGGIEVVPTLGAALGLAYRVNGFSVGAGYRWERYYGVIDGGIEERKTYDRTIDGPYLKVTFGGGS